MQKRKDDWPNFRLGESDRRVSDSPKSGKGGRFLLEARRCAPDLGLGIEGEASSRQSDAVGNAGFGVVKALQPMETQRPIRQLHPAAHQEPERQDAAQY